MKPSRLARDLAFVAALVGGGCGLKSAGTTTTGSGGSQADDAGAVGGAGGGGGGGPPIVIDVDGGRSDGPGSSNRDANCGARSKIATKLSPDVLIVLDRSGSMNDDINNRPCPGGAGCGLTSKWALMVPAITNVIGETQAEVNWGLTMFPEDITPVCTVSTTPAVEIRRNNAAAIATAIAGATSTTGGVVSYGNAPTRNAENAATAYLSS